MVKRKGDSACYPLDRTVTWLAWLARQMRERNETVFYLERMQGSWLPTPQHYHLSVGLIIGITSALYFGSVFGLLIGLLFGLRIGVMTGLLAAPLAGLIVGIRAAITEIVPAEELYWSQEHLWRSLVFTFALVIIIGCFGVLIGVLIKKWLLGLLFGLLVSLLMLLFVFIARINILGGGLTLEKLDNDKLIIPNYGIKRSVRNSLVILLFSGFLGGIGGGFLIRLFEGLIDSRFVNQSNIDLLCALLCALLCGPLAGLRNGGLACIQHIILRLFLWSTGCIPSWNYIRFLDNACKCILLQKIGGGYSFLHRSLLDFFAENSPASAESSDPLHR